MTKYTEYQVQLCSTFDNYNRISLNSLLLCTTSWARTHEPTIPLRSWDHRHSVNNNKKWLQMVRAACSQIGFSFKNNSFQDSLFKTEIWTNIQYVKGLVPKSTTGTAMNPSSCPLTSTSLTMQGSTIHIAYICIYMHK